MEILNTNMFHRVGRTNRKWCCKYSVGINIGNTLNKGNHLNI